jgi:hypothetical protein
MKKIKATIIEYQPNRYGVRLSWGRYVSNHGQLKSGQWFTFSFLDDIDEYCCVDTVAEARELYVKYCEWKHNNVVINEFKSVVVEHLPPK